MHRHQVEIFWGGLDILNQFKNNLQGTYQASDLNLNALLEFTTGRPIRKLGIEYGSVIGRPAKNHS